MKLLIVESPSKAKTIEKYLGGDFTVRASVGHVRDLPKSNKKAIDIPGGFIPHYEISAGKELVIEELKKLAKKADEVFLATDPDREGEAIAWHIKEALGLKKGKRVVFHEITKDAVTEAIKHPRDIDMNLKSAQEARRVLDRLVGYDLSGLIWKKVRYGLSAGRVQSPALRIIMEREREIRAFKSEAYYVISADVAGKNKTVFTIACEEEPKDSKLAHTIVEKGKAGSWFVKDVTESEVKRSARAPFTTSTLQQSASSRLGFSPSRTMGVAQKLYEQGHITYMRTDSTNLAQVALQQIAAYVEKTYGKEYAETRTYQTKSKNAQEAHEAIRPTHFGKENAGNTDEQKKLYRLIFERAVASQMADAKLLRTKITANIKTNDIPDFAANGSRVLFPGWLACDTDAHGEDVELPKVEKGESLDLKDIRSEEKHTEPPGRYTEAGLVKELEKRGIGRPSTYASIIKTLNDRKYVEKEGRSLKPTDTGDVVSTFLEENFMDYIGDTFTAEMENELDEIADGSREYVKTLKELYTPFNKAVKSKEKVEKLTNLGPAGDEWKCPKCTHAMIIKLGRGGKFMSCERYPDCDGARMIDGNVIEPDKPIGTDPETNLPIFVMNGRFGPYVQLGEKTKEHPKPRRASIPKDKDLGTITVPDALTYLSLPRALGVHPDTGEMITASIGRFGPYIVHQKDFRSLKTDDVYSIDLKRALEILKEEKKVGRRGRAKAPIKTTEKKK